MNGARRGAWLLLAPANIWLALFFGLPALIVVVISFWRVIDYKLVPGLGLHNYAKLAQPLYLDILGRTFGIAAIVTIFAAVIGYPVAYFLALRIRRYRLLILTLVVLPLWTSYLVRTFAWMLVLGSNGVINYILVNTGLVEGPVRWLLYSKFSVVLALVHIYIPFFILPVYAVLEKLDRRLLEASHDLGASALRTFWTVTFPLSLPGVAIGCLFVFIPAAGAYVTPELLGGPNVVMIGSVIAEQFGQVYEYPFGSALALALMAGILLSMVIILRLGRVKGVR